MISPKLSIIIPCYNCVTTLDEAFNSILESNLEEIPFEVILVDDSSTDNTYHLLSKFKKKYDFVTIDQNKRNLGGGATRNRCIDLSSGEVIFCLDSDDVLHKEALSKMYLKILKDNVDGVTFEKSIKFSRKTTSILWEDRFRDYKESERLSSLFEKNNGLFSVFMIKKEVHYKIGGYPINHGFDTQSYAFRFLLSGFKFLVCQGAIYYHRIDESHNSYYNRQMKSGLININWQYILSECLFIFKKDFKDFFLSFDFYENRENIYSICQNKKHEIIKNINTDNNLIEDFKNEFTKRRKNKYDFYTLSFLENQPEKKLYYYLKACSLGINNNSYTQIVFNYINEIYNVNLFNIKRKRNYKLTIYRRIKIRCTNILKQLFIEKR